MPLKEEMTFAVFLNDRHHVLDQISQEELSTYITPMFFTKERIGYDHPLITKYYKAVKCEELFAKNK